MQVGVYGPDPGGGTRHAAVVVHRRAMPARQVATLRKVVQHGQVGRYLGMDGVPVQGPVTVRVLRPPVITLMRTVHGGCLPIQDKGNDFVQRFRIREDDAKGIVAAEGGLFAIEAKRAVSLPSAREAIIKGVVDELQLVSAFAQVATVTTADAHPHPAALAITQIGEP